MYNWFRAGASDINRDCWEWRCKASVWTFFRKLFCQPSAMACEGKSIFVYDTGANAVTLVTPLEPLGIICQKLGLLYDAFSIDVPTIHPRKSVRQGIPLLENVLNFLESNANRVKETFQLSCRDLNGNHGAPTSQTVHSLKILIQGSELLNERLPFVAENCDTKSMTTEVNEHFSASTREFHQNTSVDTLQYVISFPSIVMYC